MVLFTGIGVTVKEVYKLIDWRCMRHVDSHYTWGKG